uniref:Uncharacterized protein n=1 Tax=Ditylenchus dipsaci TaxID=166011 RepID=A0A915E6K7_9BILA
MWCDSKKLASECGFTDLCQKYNTTSKDKPVHLTLLYESFCPACQNFIVKILPKIYTTFKDLLEVELVPYGNAKQINSTTIKCQHGRKECNANKYESCAIHSLPEPVPFITCLENLLEHGLEQAAKSV